MNTLLTIINTLLIMTHAMPKLPYAMDALEPAMSQETLEYHYGKHLQTYINNLNDLVIGTRYENSPLEYIVLNADGPLFNNAAQAWNHTFFFESLAPNPQQAPTGKLLEAINRDFGSFDAFKEQFTKAAVGIFGSGWAWLVTNDAGVLSIVSESNAGNPLTKGLRPLLTCDVWEHAYYIDYRNSRPNFLKGFWSLVDWKTVEKRYDDR